MAVNRVKIFYFPDEEVDYGRHVWGAKGIVPDSSLSLVDPAWGPPTGEPYPGMRHPMCCCPGGHDGVPCPPTCPDGPRLLRRRCGACRDLSDTHVPGCDGTWGR